MSTTTTWTVLLYGDEASWKALDGPALEALDASHRTFVARCAADGHEILASEQLEYAATARVVRRSAGRPAAPTDGPFAETAEQLGGFYLVRTADGVALAQLVADVLTEDADIRPSVNHSA